MSLRPPIVITLNGFTGTRDELPVLGTGAGMFKRTAQVLAAHGFASLRIDFRGSGDSDGEYDMMTFSTQISDAIAAIDYVQNYLADRVNPRKIGVIGLSQGGLVGSVTASKDKRVDSLVLWSPPPHAPIAYEGILSKEGVKQGLELPDGGAITLGIYIDGAYLYDVTLGKDFFKDLFAIDPLAEIQSYKRPLMVIGGLKDVIVWPQPASSEAYLKYHHVGAEKLVVLDADHTFDCVYESEKLDDAAYWSTAWFIKTLRR
jgi:pimeloyl-ACP methyl ester carboxylesterase